MPNSYTTLDLLAGSSTTNAVNQLEFGPFDFDYINNHDIHFAVKVGGEWKPILVDSFDATTKIVTLTDTPQNAHGAVDTDEARIYRSTTLNPVIDFQSGSRISESDLDNSYRQALFAAQEAAEDAPGSASRTIQVTDDIEDGAITAPKLATDSVETIKIKNLQVTSGKLANSLDLSSKTVVIPDASVTQTAVLNHVAAIKSGIDISSGMVGTLPVSNGGTGIVNTNGQVLEQFLLPCDGVSFTTRSGSVTPTSVSAEVALTDSYADVAGSVITYTPPVGTRIVLYKFIASVYSSIAGAGLFRVVLGGVTVTESRQAIASAANANWDPGRHTFEWAFPIGGTANPDTGRLSSYSDWSGGLEIKLQARRYDATYDASLHGSTFGNGSLTSMFSRPLVGITAIG